MDEDLLLADEKEQSTTKKKTPWYCFIGDFFNILKAFIGTNYQALPFAFSNSGVAFGIGGVFLIACVTDYCCQLLIKCRHIVIDRVVAEQSPQLTTREQVELRASLNKSVGYGDLGRRAFGGRVGHCIYHLIEIAVLITQYLTCVAYFIFIGNTIYEMYPMTPAQYPLTNSTPVHSNLGSSVPLVAIDKFMHGPHKKPESAVRTHTYVLEDLGDQDLAMDFDDYNVTTLAPGNITTSTIPPTPSIYQVTTAPDLKLLVLFPLGFFLLTSLIRRLRLIAPISVIASVSLFAGAVSVFVFLLSDFSVNENGFSWVKWAPLPIFIGQLISAYEGIGCLIPIESSMEGNQHVFRWFLHANVFIVFLILTAFGSVGYVRYGNDVKQLIVLSIPQHTTWAMVVDVTLIISVLCTYPLQCFPILQIAENYLLAPSKGGCCGPSPAPLEEEEEEPAAAPGGGHIHELPDDARSMERSIELSVASVAVTVPSTVPRWKRNVLRLSVTLSIGALAILTRNLYAYLAAFSGAVACSLLAYILPCVIHLRLTSAAPRWPLVGLHIVIISLAVLASAFTLIVMIAKIAHGQVAF